MSQLTVQTATIIPFAKHLRPTSAGFAVAYSYKPAGKLGLERGTLMAVIEVLGATVAAEESIDAIMQTLSDSYYSEDPEKSAEDAAHSIHQRFSDAVREVNQVLQDEGGKGRQNWEQRINAVLAVLVHDELYLTQTGTAHAFLVRGQRSSRITREGNNLDQLFSEIATGALAVGDKLALVSPALLHQLAEGELIEIVADTQPSTAIARISDLLHGQTNVERVAALIAVVTTPELLAQQLRHDEEDVIEVGKPTSNRLLGGSRGKSAPDDDGDDLSIRAKRAIKRSRKAGKGLYTSHLKGKGGQAGGWLKRNLRKPSVLVGAATAAILLTGGLIFASQSGHGAANQKQLSQQYRQALSSYQQAVSASDNATAQTKLAAATTSLDAAQHNPAAGQLTKALQHNGGLTNPASILELRKLIATEADKRAGLEHRSVTTMRQLPVVKDSSYYLAAAGNSLYAVASKGGLISGYNLTSKQPTPDSSPPKSLGTVVAISANSAGDTLYLLTTAPAVWSYTPATNQYNQININGDSWPQAAAISSYNENLYLISNNNVTKQVPTLAGFSVPNTSISLANTPASGGNTLYVDGDVYVGGGSGIITRFTAGKQTGQASGLPDAIKQPIQLLTSNSSLFSLDKSGHIGLFTTSDTAITFTKQLVLDGNGTASGLSYDPVSNSLYVTRGNQLIKVNPAK